MEQAIRLFFVLAAVVGGPLFAVMIVPALARRISKSSTEPAEAPHSEELEALQQRVAELEERVDFAERLLAQQRDAALPRGKS